jgi:hypothetical protein
VLFLAMVEWGFCGNGCPERGFLRGKCGGVVVFVWLDVVGFLGVGDGTGFWGLFFCGLGTVRGACDWLEQATTTTNAGILHCVQDDDS